MSIICTKLLILKPSSVIHYFYFGQLRNQTFDTFSSLLNATYYSLVNLRHHISMQNQFIYNTSNAF